MRVLTCAITGPKIIYFLMFSRTALSSKWWFMVETAPAVKRCADLLRDAIYFV